MNKQEKKISVSLVGTPISDDAIATLEKALPDYNLDGYTLRVTQNSILENVDGTETDTDKITIAVQENRISELQSQLADANKQIKNMEKDIHNYELAQEEAVDSKEIVKKAQAVFTKITTGSCGVMSDVQGDYVFFVAETEEPLSEEEEQTIIRWLQTETGYDRAELIRREASEATEEVTSESTEE